MRTWLVALLASTMALSGCLSGDDGDMVGTNPPPASGGSTIGGIVDSTDEVIPYIPGDYNFSGPYSQVLEEGPYGILPQGRFTFPSDQDGADIEMALWLPDVPEGELVGTLLFSSPYFAAPGSQLGGTRTVDNPGGSVQILIDNVVPYGFAFATHSIRGTAGSGGCNDLMGPTETADVDQAVTYLGTQSWSNGKVGMTGVSYDGSTPWAAATTGNPHLATIIPVSGVPDMHGLMYRNGSSETRGPALLNALYIAGGIQSRADMGMVEGALCPEAYEGLALSVITGLHGSDATGYWQERNRKPDVEANYRGSVFSIQGLQDWNVDPSQVVPWVDELDKMGLKTKQLLGQWGHAWPDGSIGSNENGTRADGSNIWADLYRADFKETLIMWLRSELNGEDVWTGPPVQVMDSERRWRNEATFPPRDATWTTYHMSSDGGLELEPNGADSIIMTPNPPQVINLNNDQFRQGIDVLTNYVDFTLAAGDEDMLISGLPKVHVTVTPHGPGGYMAAYLYERDSGDGSLQRLGWTTMNLGYADGTTIYTPVVPGQPLKAMMEIQPMDGVVEAGNHLVLRLWVFTDGDRLPTIPPNGANLEIGHPMETVLKLPTLDRADTDYFMPPVPQAWLDEQEVAP